MHLVAGVSDSVPPRLMSLWVVRVAVALREALLPDEGGWHWRLDRRASTYTSAPGGDGSRPRSSSRPLGLVALRLGTTSCDGRA